MRVLAGYVRHKVHTSLEQSSIPEKDDMTSCGMSSAGDEDNDGETETRLNTIDRGGLWHVNHMSFTLFLILEEGI